MGASTSPPPPPPPPPRPRSGSPYNDPLYPPPSAPPPPPPPPHSGSPYDDSHYPGAPPPPAPPPPSQPLHQHQYTAPHVSAHMEDHIPPYYTPEPAPRPEAAEATHVEREKEVNSEPKATKKKRPPAALFHLLPLFPILSALATVIIVFLYRNENIDLFDVKSIRSSRDLTRMLLIVQGCLGALCVISTILMLTFAFKYRQLRYYALGGVIACVSICAGLWVFADISSYNFRSTNLRPSFSRSDLKTYKTVLLCAFMMATWAISWILGGIFKKLLDGSEKK